MKLEIDADCVNHQCDPRSALRESFFEIMGEGLDELDRWSHPVALRIANATWNRSLVLSCLPSPEGTYGLFFETNGRKWVLPTPFVDLVLDELAENGSCPARGGRPTQDFLRRQNAKNNLFHEFLHFAGFEALPDHGSLTGSRIDRRQLDRVYACAALAFPLPTQINPSRAATMRSCLTCLGDDPHARERCGALP